MPRIAIPTSQSDIHLLKPLRDVMVALGGLESHSVLIAPAPSVFDQAAEIMEPLKAISRDYLCKAVAAEPEGGWPLAPNQHFKYLVDLLVEIGNQEPFLNMEPDCTPMRPAWVDDLFAEYRAMKKPYMGVIRPTSEVWRGKEGHHMVGGCAIYGHDFHLGNTLWCYPRPDQPYDVWMRDVIGPRAHNTKLIQHLRRTERFEETGGGITCHDCPREDAKEFEANRHLVSPDAVLVHGCRDSSLARIVLKSLGADLPPVIEATKEKEPDDSLYQRVKDAIGGERMTIKSLAETLSIDKAVLREALEKPDSPFVVRPPILWVSLRE